MKSILLIFFPCLAFSLEIKEIVGDYVINPVETKTFVENELKTLSPDDKRREVYKQILTDVSNESSTVHKMVMRIEESGLRMIDDGKEEKIEIIEIKKDGDSIVIRFKDKMQESNVGFKKFKEDNLITTNVDEKFSFVVKKKGMSNQAVKPSP